MSVYTIWQSISNNGVKAQHGFDDIRRIRILNQFIAIGVFVTLLYSALILILGSPYLAFFDFEIALQGAVAFLLVRHTNYRIASVFVFICLPFGLMLFNYVYGRQGAEYYYFPMLILAFYMYRRHWTVMVLLFYLLVLFALAKYLEATVVPEGLAAILSPYFYYTSFVFSFIFGLIILRLFASEYEKHQKEIEYKNILLDEAAKEALQQSEEISVLLKELNHRTKNNLQLVSSIIGIQSNRNSNEEVREALNNVRNRLTSMLLIHQKLFGEKAKNKVSLKEYVDDLVLYLQNTFEKPENPICITINVENIYLNIDQSLTLGLIINELLTNSFKHGVAQSEKGTIGIKITSLSVGKLMVIVSDSGRGVSALSNSNGNSFGTRLILSLVKQMNGTLATCEENGNEVKMELFVRDTNFVNHE